MKTLPSPGLRAASRRPAADRRCPAAPNNRTVVAWIVALIVALAVAVGSAAKARSQVAANDGGLSDGTYSGGIYFKMGGSLDLGEVIGMTNSVDAAGDATLIVDLEAPSISGIWEFEGTGSMGGSGTFQGQTATFSGSSTVTGSGTFSGTPRDGRLKGTSNSKGTWIISTSKGSSPSIPSGGTGTLNEPLTDLLSECSQLLGKWDSELGNRLEAEYAAQGASLNVTRLVAYFVLSDAGLITEESWMADRLRGLAKRGSSTLGEARGGGDAFVAIVEGVELLRDVEKLQADIAALESDCPASKAFQNILTLIAQDGLDEALEGLEVDPTIELEAKTLRDMVRPGNGTGATGAGAKDTERAVDLDSRVEVQTNEAFNDALDVYTSEDGGDAAFDEAVSLAALGEQQDWDLENSSGTTGADILAAKGN